MKILYTDHKGERRERIVMPIRIAFRASKYHMGVQWIMDAYDCEDGDRIEEFALCGLDPAWQIAEYVWPADPMQAKLFDRIGQPLSAEASRQAKLFDEGGYA